MILFARDSECMFKCSRADGKNCPETLAVKSWTGDPISVHGWLCLARASCNSSADRGYFIERWPRAPALVD